MLPSRHFKINGTRIRHILSQLYLLVPNSSKSAKQLGLGSKESTFDRYPASAPWPIFMSLMKCSSKYGIFHLGPCFREQVFATASKHTFRLFYTLNNLHKKQFFDTGSLSGELFDFGLPGTQKDTNLQLLVQISLKPVQRLRLGRTAFDINEFRNNLFLSNAALPQSLSFCS